ncbi:MAG TPA: hypothetical protein VFN35_22895 [Ktedonobacteraceae bacterium]|nr:hypothetical protein [Ktedonobacteraceae bacterium]
MKLRLTHRPNEAFEAGITTDHPASIAGPIALKRTDTGAFIALDDCFGLLGTVRKKYDLLEISKDERTQLHAAGIMIMSGKAKGKG